jgi:DNA mismatch endonuclease (patch repair protein)
MADVHSPKQRSYNMSRVKARDTKPEMLLRRGLHAKGFRYRLHSPGLPGKPDLVLPRHSAVVQVNGCFWHGHNCHLFVLPGTNRTFWTEKIQANRERDERTKARLESQGWRVLTLWECALKGRGHPPIDAVLEEVSSWITSAKPSAQIPPRRGR